MTEQKKTYVAFARKYRPKNFAALLGQEVLVKTLSSAVKNNRLAQAYLLTGIRGIGKTSSARIIAKTVNCNEPDISQELVLPCEHCRNCQSFSNLNHPDILEIDAASRTSVDDIREIIESAEYRPLLGKYKFFIIDEIHMLSKSAFNALLKIVEEPPEHVIFIFATTEVQKIPLTIISRCQRYDLRRFTFKQIFVLLKQIAQTEQMEIEDEALKIIAHYSEGSARDAISLLDQASSYITYLSSQSQIKAEQIKEMLGLIGIDFIIDFVSLILEGKADLAIKALHEVYFKSANLTNFVNEIGELIAELCKYKVMENYQHPLYIEYIAAITDIVIKTDLSRLSILWQIFNNGAAEIRKSHNELVFMEMLVIKSIYACQLPKIEEILDAGQNVAISPSVAAAPVLAKANPALKLDAETKKQTPNQDSDSQNIYHFLKYCQANQAMEIYYFLMNEVEIMQFAQNIIEIKLANISNHIANLKKVLCDWSGSEWQVKYTKSDEFYPLKQKFLDKVKNSEDYKSIKNHFPDADILDIILKQE